MASDENLEKILGEPSLEPGSFRDKANRVFYRDRRVFRALSQGAYANWVALHRTAFFHRLLAEGQLVPTTIASSDAVPSDIQAIWAAVLEHERIPFVSYPYEWSFEMLRAAALFQLEILEVALTDSYTLKDCSAYNVQWMGTSPVFIDICSFVPWEAGQPWIGYKQFCDLFLNPLFLEAYAGIPFRPWLRGSIDGIVSEDCANLLSRHFYRGGVLTHVLLHAKLQKGYADSKIPVKGTLQTIGFGKEMIVANLRGLKKTIKNLAPKKSKTVWTEYTRTKTYDSENYEAKKAFVKEAVAAARPELLWDIGCNTGDFSRVAATYARYVVAMDTDARVIDRLFLDLQAEKNKTILPLVMNVADPSPNLGWRGLERKSLIERGAPDFVLCLALIHHICITHHVPMNEFVGWLASITNNMVIEFVGQNDPMVLRLLRNKENLHEDYNQDVFESILNEFFEVESSLSLNAGHRKIYECHSRRKHKNGAL